MIEPVDPFEGRELDGFEIPPRPLTTNHFGLVQSAMGHGWRSGTRTRRAGDGEEAGQETNAAETQEPKLDELPAALTLVGSRSFETGPTFSVEGDNGKDFDSAEVAAWAEKHIPKFVLIQDYGLSGTQIELNTLAERCKQIKWHELTNDEQTIKIVLDLAKVDIDDFLARAARRKDARFDPSTSGQRRPI